MGLLDLNEILNKEPELPFMEVETPEWGGAVKVYAISEREHNDALKAARVNGEIDNALLWVLLRAASLRISRDQSATLLEHPAAVVDRFDTAINRLNRWTGEARREDEKLFRAGAK